MAYRITKAQQGKVLGSIKKLPKDTFGGTRSIADHLFSRGDLGFARNQTYAIVNSLRSGHEEAIARVVVPGQKSQFRGNVRKFRQTLAGGRNARLKGLVEALPRKGSFRSIPAIGRAVGVKRENAVRLFILYPSLKERFPNLMEEREVDAIWKARKPALEHVGRTIGGRLRHSAEIQAAVNGRLREVHGKAAGPYLIKRSAFVRSRFDKYPEIEALFPGWLEQTAAKRAKSARRARVLRELGLERGGDFRNRMEVIRAANERLDGHRFPPNTTGDELRRYMPGDARGLFPFVDAVWRGERQSARMASWERAFQRPATAWKPPPRLADARDAMMRVDGIERALSRLPPQNVAERLEQRARLASLAADSIRGKSGGGEDVKAMEDYLSWARRSERYHNTRARLMSAAQNSGG